MGFSNVIDFFELQEKWTFFSTVFMSNFMSNFHVELEKRKKKSEKYRRGINEYFFVPNQSRADTEQET